MLFKGFPDVVIFSMEIRTVALYCCFSPCLNKMQLPSFLFPPKKKKETETADLRSFYFLFLEVWTNRAIEVVSLKEPLHTLQRLRFVIILVSAWRHQPASSNWKWKELNIKIVVCSSVTEFIVHGEHTRMQYQPGRFQSLILIIKWEIF